MTALLCWMLLIASGAVAQEITRFISGPATPVTAGNTISVWLHCLNPGSQSVTCVVPPKTKCQLTGGTHIESGFLELKASSEAGPVTVQPGMFIRREYLLAIPSGVEGHFLLAAPELQAQATPLEIVAGAVAPQAAKTGGTTNGTGSASSRMAAPPESGFDAGQFFKDHLYGYEPFYFIAGTESPNAKFQVSVKYRVLKVDPDCRSGFSLLTNMFFAYTQTSLWDWNKTSAPFTDSSYKPELFYLWENAARKQDGSFRMSLQGGFQHESNGRDGAGSRSLNIVYARPTFVFGSDDGLQLSLSPRVWFYLASQDGNPDLPRYRGYADLRAIVGWQESLQLSATVRVGDEADRGSLQLDLTYPLWKWRTFGMNWYFHAQYFTGYGETLLYYNQRSDAFRLGFSLYR